MYYEINVSRATQSQQRSSPRYLHFFATDKRSVTDEATLRVVYAVMKKAFPTPEYVLTVTQWETTGHQINMTTKGA